MCIGSFENRILQPQHSGVAVCVLSIMLCVVVAIVAWLDLVAMKKLVWHIGCNRELQDISVSFCTVLIVVLPRPKGSVHFQYNTVYLYMLTGKPQSSTSMAYSKMKLASHLCCQTG